MILNIWTYKMFTYKRPLPDNIKQIICDIVWIEFFIN